MTHVLAGLPKFSLASLQRLKIEAFIPASANCKVQSVIKFLNAQLCQQSFPADFPLLVAQNCHKAPVVQKIVRQVSEKATHQNTKRSAWSQHWQLWFIFFYTLRNFCPAKHQRFLNDREVEMSITQRFQSQAADFDTGIQKLVPWYDICLNSRGKCVGKIAQHLLYLFQ